jgi:hypothetical protein
MLPPHGKKNEQPFKVLLKTYIIERLNKYITILRDGSEINIQFNKSLDML